MNIEPDFLGHPVVERMGWALIHLVWQGAAVALVLAVLLWFLRHRSANFRYVVACIALLLLPVSLFVTFAVTSAPARPANVAAGWELPTQPAHARPASTVRRVVRVERTAAENMVTVGRVSQHEIPQRPALLPATPSRNSTLVTSATSGVVPSSPHAPRVAGQPQSETPCAQIARRTDVVLPWLVAGWFAGVFTLSVWHLGCWRATLGLRRRDVQPVPQAVRITLNELRRRLGVAGSVELLESARVKVPSLLGIVRPVILLPGAVLTGLTPQQLEAVLAHELAHVRRWDHLAILLQTTIETLLYFHPAVWWISRRVCEERENCCDDLALLVTADRVLYARSLERLELLRQQADAPHWPVLAATGSSLLERIRRIVGAPRRRSVASRAALFGLTGLSGFAITAAALLLLSIGTPDVATIVAAPNDGQPSVDDTQEEPKQKQPAGKTEQNTEPQSPRPIREDEDILDYHAEIREQAKRLGPYAFYTQPLPHEVLEDSTLQEPARSMRKRGAERFKRFVADLPRPRTVARLLELNGKETDALRRADFLYLLQCSRDPRAAVAIAESKGNLVMLEGYFAPMMIGGSDARAHFLEQWWKENEKRLRAEARERERAAEKRANKPLPKGAPPWVREAAGLRMELKVPSNSVTITVNEPEKPADKERPAEKQPSTAEYLRGQIERYSKEAEDLHRAGRLLEAQQHADKAERFRQQLKELEGELAAKQRPAEKQLSTADYLHRQIQRYSKEAEGLRRVGRLLEAQQHADHAERFRQTLEELERKKKREEESAWAEYLHRQIRGLLKEAEDLHAAGRLEDAKQHAEKAAYRVGQLQELQQRRQRAAGRAETKKDAATPVDLDKKRLMIETHPADKLSEGLFALGPYPLNYLPDARALYQWRLEKKIPDGHLELVGRMRGDFDPGLNSFEVERFERAGNKITGVIRRVDVERDIAGREVNVYVHAKLPPLPPGKYSVQISFRDVVHKGGVRLVPAAMTRDPISCTFEVPAKPATQPIDLGKKYVRIEIQPADKNPAKLFAVTFLPNNQIPTAKFVYEQRLNGKLSDGIFQLVGRLPGISFEGDRFEIQRYERRGRVITLDLKHTQLNTIRSEPPPPKSVYFIADLPNRLPAGNIVAHVRIDVGNGKPRQVLSCLAKQGQEVDDNSREVESRIARLKSTIAKRGIHLGESITAPAIAGRKPKQEGLALEVEFQAHDHLLAEPMLVRCSLVNYSDKPITLSYGSRYEQQNTIFFDVTGPDGKPVAWSSDEIDSPGPQPLTIPPGQRYIESYNLVDYYSLTKPGTYRISVRYESDGRSFNPSTLKRREDLWKGELVQSLGAVKIVEPTRPADEAALKAILSRATYPQDSPHRFLYLFAAEASDSFDAFVQEHSKSHYAAYARYGNALAALHRVSSGTRSYAKEAIANLESIDAAGYPRLFAEQTLLHLIQAHAAADSPPEQINPFLQRFLSTYPHSPFVAYANLDSEEASSVSPIERFQTQWLTIKTPKMFARTYWNKRVADAANLSVSTLHAQSAIQELSQTAQPTLSGSVGALRKADRCAKVIVRGERLGGYPQIVAYLDTNSGEVLLVLFDNEG